MSGFFLMAHRRLGIVVYLFGKSSEQREIVNLHVDRSMFDSDCGLIPQVRHAQIDADEPKAEHITDLAGRTGSAEWIEGNSWDALGDIA